MTYDQIIRFGNRVKPKIATKAHQFVFATSEQDVPEFFSAHAHTLKAYHERSKVIRTDAEVKAALRELWWLEAIMSVLVMRMHMRSSKFETILGRLPVTA